jgi:hypothetical protein
MKLLKTADEILDTEIVAYNSTVPDIVKFKLSKQETAMFTKAMDTYAKQEIGAFLEYMKLDLPNDMTIEEAIQSYYEQILSPK